MIVSILIIILAGSGYYLYLRISKETASQEKESPVASPSTSLNPEEQKQLEEISALRQTDKQKPPTKEEIKTQTEELDTLRQQVSGSPSAKDVSGQADELDKLRAQSQQQ